MNMSGAGILIKSLEDEGVKTIFGLPGGTVIPMYDALYDSSIDHVLMRHEQAAAHAADGFSRAGGSVGVCFATSGPGATNLVTGIATACMDSSPMVAVTGQVASKAIGTDAFQEAFILGISMPVVKHSMQIRSAAGIPGAIRDAFYIASTGRPGPVLVDIPVDVQKAPAEYRRASGHGESFPGYSPEPPEDLECIEEAADLVRSAERPVLLAGNGVNISRAFAQLAEFSEKFGIPVATSLLGKGAISDDHPNRVGMIGMHGHAAANRAVTNADVIIAVGTRFSDRSTGKVAEFAKSARVIHIDIDNAEIKKSVGADVWLIGDASRVLSALAAEISGSAGGAPRAGWLERVRAFEAAEPLARNSGDGAVHAWQVIEAMDEVLRGEAIVTTEVGQNQMWAAQYHKALYPRRFVTSGGLGTMGFGIPSAIGAHYGGGGMPVVCIAGDGSAMMNIQELDTCARRGIPIKIFVLDNNCLGMVKQWQELFFNKRYSNTVYSRRPDFVKIAQGMGVEAFMEDRPNGVKLAIERAMNVPGPALVHFIIPESDNVFPMVPAGEPLENMML
ncbi:MAG: biosynthetic-type acetolactate synthase large subunit [Synergistaceae bacterium]|jgi:acetolactate synthase-1/2/3 large subunit|nr:biosynthetic-type acetolactate synthase large subunit [Synergistaceae bacterium]